MCVYSFEALLCQFDALVCVVEAPTQKFGAPEHGFKAAMLCQRHSMSTVATGWACSASNLVRSHITCKASSVGLETECVTVLSPIMCKGSKPNRM